MAVFRTEGAGEDMWLGRGVAGLREIYAAAGLSEEEAAPCVAAFSDRAALTAFLNWYRAGDPADPTAKPVATPSLYVWSTNDPALGREAAEWTGDYVLGDYRFEVLAGVDHWVPEHAAERLTALLLDHLAKHA
jgi:pimeloyl-ACP methyl ester carboxylesterase